MNNIYENCNSAIEACNIAEKKITIIELNQK